MNITKIAITLNIILLFIVGVILIPPFGNVLNNDSELATTTVKATMSTVSSSAITTLKDFQQKIPSAERANIYETAESYVRKNSIEFEFDLNFKWKKENWIHFEVIPHPTQTWETDNAMLFLEKVDGQWVGQSLGTAPIELYEKHPELWD